MIKTLVHLLAISKVKLVEGRRETATQLSNIGCAIMLLLTKKLIDDSHTLTLSINCISQWLKEWVEYVICISFSGALVIFIRQSVLSLNDVMWYSLNRKVD